MGEHQEIDCYFYAFKMSSVFLKVIVLHHISKVIPSHITENNIFHCVIGIIGTKPFTDILLDLVTLNLGTNSLPSSWMHLTQPEVSICFVWVSKL